MKNKLESVIIVKNNFGGTATMRFEDKKDDKILSATNRTVLYSLTEKYISEVLNV